MSFNATVCIIQSDNEGSAKEQTIMQCKSNEGSNNI